ncbi:hypothetical protein VTK73DRAFT_1310 [Phialemonium thermophilum]|uniref:Uncharacterized protein n=1 Tax=Phialemonium thermophilum TaxID=223376 RepID=A0ABR3VTP0_9PEZI
MIARFLPRVTSGKKRQTHKWRFYTMRCSQGPICALPFVKSKNTTIPVGLDRYAAVRSRGLLPLGGRGPARAVPPVQQADDAKVDVEALVPLCTVAVSNRVRPRKAHMVRTWAPSSRGGSTAGKVLASRCSAGWAYWAARATGAVKRWWALWTAR